MPRSPFRAARTSLILLCITSTTAGAEEIVTTTPLDLDLPVVAGKASHTGSDDLDVRATLHHDGDALGIRIEVVDDDLVFAEENLQGDHVELTLAPPPNPYFDQPDNFFRSELLNTRYWFADEKADEVLAHDGWIYDTWPMPDGCYGADGRPAVDQHVLLERAPVRLGQVRYAFNPFTGKVVPRESDPSGGMRVSELASHVQVRHLELTDNGYLVDLALPPRSLGLVAKTGISQLRLRLDVIDIDTADERPALASTTARPQATSPIHFKALRLEPALTFRPDPRLPFIGTPARPDPHEQALLERVPPFFLWSGLEWLGAEIGQMPGEERGHDFCTAGIGSQMIAHEAELLVGPLAYTDFNLPDREASAFEGEVVVDGKPVYTPEGEVRHLFALDEATLGIVDAYHRPDRGRFSRGPCAAASSQYTDLVLVSGTGTSRHPLHSQSTCSAWPTINGESVDDESEYLFDPPLEIDTATRTLTLSGGRFDHVWTLAQTEGAWSPQYRRVHKSAPEQPMAVRLSALSNQHRYGEIDTATFMQRFGTIVGPEGAHLVDRSLDQVVCEMARGATALELRLALADFAGSVPDCMIPEWTRLPQYVDGEDPDAGRLRAELDALLSGWQPDSETALRMAADYLVGGALLDDPDDETVREIAWDTASRILERATTWDAPRRHTETMYRSHLFSAVRTAVPRTWDILLGWETEPEKADRLVETALAHYIMQEDRERFDTLFARHELPPASNRYLLMIAANRPEYAQALLGTGVAWTDRLDNGDTLLHRVAARRNASPDWITPLADAGIDPDAPDAEGLTALQRLYGKTIRGYQGDHESLRDKARALIAAGAKVDGLDADGHGLLWHALAKEATHGRTNQGMFAGPLLEAGINVDRIDATGTSALHHAVALGIDWMIEPLIAHGADPDPTDENGATPLMQALYSAQTNVARQLLEAGADTTMRDHAGRRACDYIGRSLATNPARQHALHIDYGCNATPPQPWPALWPVTGDCDEPPIVYAAKTDERWNLHRIHPDGTGERRIVSGGNKPIAWLRVAPALGHIGYSDQGEARILACGATEPVTVRNDAYFMDWYPDGERILIAGRNRALCNLYVDGSTHCFGRSPGMSIDIAPDGRRLVTNYGASMPVIHDLEQRKTHDLLDRDSVGTRQQNLQPRFLPDGETVSYIRRVEENHWQLMAGIPGTADFNVILDGDLGLWKHAWSPDGIQVIHAHGPSANATLIIHNRETGKAQPVATIEQPISAVDWMWP